VPALYWWDTLDQHGLLHCTQGTLKGSCAADGVAASSTAYGSRPQGSGRKKRKTERVIDLQNGGEDDASAITASQTKAGSIASMNMTHERMVKASEANALGRDEIALTNLYKSMQELKDKIFELEEHLEDPDISDSRKARFQRRLDDAKADMEVLVDRILYLQEDVDDRRDETRRARWEEQDRRKAIEEGIDENIDEE
jgi:hypothetical protein